MVRITPGQPTYTSLGLLASRYNARPIDQELSIRLSMSDPLYWQCWVTSEYETNNVCDGRCDQFVRTHQHICCKHWRTIQRVSAETDAFIPVIAARQSEIQISVWLTSLELGKQRKIDTKKVNLYICWYKKTLIHSDICTFSGCLSEYHIRREERGERNISSQKSPRSKCSHFSLDLLEILLNSLWRQRETERNREETERLPERSMKSWENEQSWMHLSV